MFLCQHGYMLTALEKYSHNKATPVLVLHIRLFIVFLTCHMKLTYGFVCLQVEAGGVSRVQ